MDVSIKTKTPRIRTAPAPEPEPTAPEPSPDELVARRMLDWHGDSVIDIYIDRVRRAEVGWLADRDDPYAGYLRMTGWCASRRSWSRERHEDDAHATLMRAVATGADVVPVDEAAIDAAVAKDLLYLYFQNCRGAFARLTAAARRRRAAAVAELDEIGPRATGGELFDPTRPAGWRELKNLLARERELLDSIGRMGSLLDGLGPALAGRVGDALVTAGVDRVTLGMCLASLPTAPAPLESDPELVRLGEALAAARRRCDALESEGTPAEKGALADLEQQLTGPIAISIYARREEIATARSRLATESLASVRGVIDRARSGDVAAVESLIDAARTHASDFPEGFGDRLHAAATAAFVESDAVGWSELLESA